MTEREIRNANCKMRDLKCEMIINKCEMIIANTKCEMIIAKYLNHNSNYQMLVPNDYYICSNHKTR